MKILEIIGRGILATIFIILAIACIAVSIAYVIKGCAPMLIFPLIFACEMGWLAWFCIDNNNWR